MYSKILSTIILCVAAVSLVAQPLTKPSKGAYVLQNATIQTVTNGTVQGSILIQDGRITAIGEVDAPAGAEVIDCTDHTIYPGMIDSYTRLGLAEVGSVSLTNDYREVGRMNPHMQALTAVNPNSVAIPVTRVSGVTSALAVPAGGLFSGTAALINLVGYTPDQMYAGFKGVMMNFPYSGRRGRRDRRSEEDIKKDMEKNMKEVNKIWEETQLYVKIKADGGMPEYSAEMEAMAEVVKGDMPLLINVDREKDIRAAIEWVKSKELDNVIFCSVAEGWRVAEELAEADIPVIVGPILRTPPRASDRYDVAYRNPGIMQKAGVKVAITSGDTENVRNLPYNAGFAATYGMGKEEALKAITINPAEIFGVADELGSLEVGKRANLFVADGDPMETKTQVKYVFIDGWKVPMDSRHIRLYNEFLERQPGLRK